MVLFAFFYNYITYYTTLVDLSPGFSKFYYAWATVTYALFIVAGVLWTQHDNRDMFFYRPYFFWFVSFASLVHMITSFAVEAVVVSEIKEEPKKKSVQQCVVIDMVFGIIPCGVSIYLSYVMYQCQGRYALDKCAPIIGLEMNYS